MATLYDVLQGLRDYVPTRTKKLEVKPENLKWCQKFIGVHTVFCEESIKGIVKSIEKIRSQSSKYNIIFVVVKSP